MVSALKGSCSCCFSRGHLNHMERSRFWFRVGGCHAVTQAASKPAPCFHPGPLVPFPAGMTETSPASAFPRQQVLIHAVRAWCRRPVRGTFCVCRTPGTHGGCDPRRRARAVCGGRRRAAGGGTSRLPPVAPSGPCPGQPSAGAGSPPGVVSQFNLGQAAPATFCSR